MTKVNPTTYIHPLSADALDDTQAAAAYERMEHTPRAFAVEESYLHFRHETITQYLNLRTLGFVPIWDAGDHEYPDSRALFADLDDPSRRVFVRHTFLSGDDTDIPQGHPMALEVNRYLGDEGRHTHPLMLNDIFRFVHDVNGHWGGEDARHYSFGPNGERNAWKRHRNLYTRKALPALWCETRGQSAWTNAYADHGTMPLSQRPFATQKAGIVPAFLI